jgi:hypothetical protein
MNHLIALTALALLVCPFADAAENDWCIIPGKRVGQILIGMEHAEVLRLLGAPHRQDDLGYRYDGEELANTLRDDWISPLPISAHPESGEGVFMANFLTIYVRDRRVVQIEIRAPRFKTKEGLSSASTGIAWRRQFPHYKGTFQKFGHASAGGLPATKHLITFEDAVGVGIAWRYAVMGNLAPDTDPEERVETVAVHVPGEPMIVDPDGGSRFIWKDDPRRHSTED